MSDSPVFTAWITKYALTSGISQRQVCLTGHEGMIVEYPPRGLSAYYHGEGREWHRTLEGAQKYAEEMREKRIKSLQRSIAKLQKLKIKVQANA